MADFGWLEIFLAGLPMKNINAQCVVCSEEQHTYKSPQWFGMHLMISLDSLTPCLHVFTSDAPGSSHSLKTCIH